MNTGAKYFLFFLLIIILICQFIAQENISVLDQKITSRNINKSPLTLSVKETRQEPKTCYVNPTSGVFYHTNYRCPSMLAFEGLKDNAFSAESEDEFVLIYLYEAAYRGFELCPECLLYEIQKTSNSSSSYSLSSDIYSLKSELAGISKDLNSLESDVQSLEWEVEDLQSMY